MEALTPYLVDILAPVTVVNYSLSFLLLGWLAVLEARKLPCGKMMHRISKHGLLLIFFVALSGMLGSLFLSEISLWIPCKLCWYQRIFLYPVTFLAGLAFYRRDRRIVPYVLLLSVVGMVIAAYHYGEQVLAKLNPEGFDPLAPCDLTGISCRVDYIDFVYGHITIPVMAFTQFLVVVTICLIMLRCDKRVS